MLTGGSKMILRYLLREASPIASRLAMSRGGMPGVHGEEIKMDPMITGILLAQTVIQNATTGNISFIEVFSDFRLAMPSTIGFYVVTAYAGGSHGGFSHEVRVNAPGGSFWEAQLPIPKVEVNLSYVATGPVALQIQSAGEIDIEIRIDTKLAFSQRYPIKIVPVAVPAQGELVTHGPLGLKDS